MPDRTEILDAISSVDDVPAQGPSINFKPGHSYDVATWEEIPRVPILVLPRVPQGSTPALAQDRKIDGSPPVYRRPASTIIVVCGSQPRKRSVPEAAPLELVSLSPSQLLTLDDNKLMKAIVAGQCGEYYDAYINVLGRSVTFESLGDFRDFLRREQQTAEGNQKSVTTGDAITKITLGERDSLSADATSRNEISPVLPDQEAIVRHQVPEKRVVDLSPATATGYFDFIRGKSEEIESSTYGVSQTRDKTLGSLTGIKAFFQRFGLRRSHAGL